MSDQQGMSEDERLRAQRDESEAERADRNFAELLQELRVIQTGVQILVAFLLTLPFQARFATLDSFQRGIYVTTLLLAVLATILFTAPAALHRQLFRKGMKRELVEASSRLAGAGMVVLAFALTSAVLLVVDVVHGTPEALVAAAATFIVCGVMWALVPRHLGRKASRTD
ncbi:DUF6328 family protein [Streptomyces fructofermentans]|uniref:Membrane protein n=1 Tax=Streptomyces fructofermentans TaxID=152141 RepID=A0A918U276_9ACTN|nr:DUF6328 family protein [Streptomyces fructofermentans]GGX81015.1 membrane protein [Streptomyces fructofermentans]